MLALGGFSFRLVLGNAEVPVDLAIRGARLPCGILPRSVQYHSEGGCIKQPPKLFNKLIWLIKAYWYAL